MTAWRMAFRAGKNGFSMWPECRKRGVAAIEYGPVDDIDLSRHPKGEPQTAWSQLASSQKASLRRLVYEMKMGDLIYVKEGRRIIGKGVVIGPYHFRRKTEIQDPTGAYWQHQRRVRWTDGFPRPLIQVGRAQQHTVEALDDDDVERIEKAAKPVYIDSQHLTPRQIDEALQNDVLRLGIVPTASTVSQRRQRVGQERIRRLVIRNYGRMCSVCDIAEPTMLVASHIVGWAEDKRHRGDLSNVVCLCRIHDALFEAGYWSLSDDLHLLKREAVKSDTIRHLLDAMTSFRAPKCNSPDARFVTRHRRRSRL